MKSWRLHCLQLKLFARKNRTVTQTGMASAVDKDSRLVLLTGASGDVGGRLLRALEAKGCNVRCLARRPEFLAPRVGPNTQVIKGDVLDASSLDAAMAEVEAAYCLVHSMRSSGAFEEKDRKAAALRFRRIPPPSRGWAYSPQRRRSGE